LFNDILSVIFTIRFVDTTTPFNHYELEVYKEKTKTETTTLIAKTINLLLSSHFSEMISTDIDITYKHMSDDKL